MRHRLAGPISALLIFEQATSSRSNLNRHRHADFVADTQKLLTVSQPADSPAYLKSIPRLFSAGAGQAGLPVLQVKFGTGQVNIGCLQPSLGSCYLHYRGCDHNTPFPSTYIHFTEVCRRDSPDR